MVHACFVWFRLQISKAFLLEPQRCSAAGSLLAHHTHIELPFPSHLMAWGEPHVCACIGDTSLANHQPPSRGSSTFLLLVKTSDRLPGHSWRKCGQLWVSEPETESISGLLKGSSVFTLPTSAVCSREKKRPQRGDLCACFCGKAYLYLLQNTLLL